MGSGPNSATGFVEGYDGAINSLLGFTNHYVPSLPGESASSFPPGALECHDIYFAGLSIGKDLVKASCGETVDIVALQGTRWKGRGAFSWKGWRVVVGEAQQGVDGTLVALYKRSGAVRATAHLPGRILEVRWRRRQIPVMALCAYAPTMQRPEDERGAFWKALDPAAAQVSTRYHLVVAGDFNATRRPRSGQPMGGF